MISGKDIYAVVSAIIPLYAAMILGYASVRWWKIFTPDQCNGINRFVASFAYPFLVLSFIGFNNLYTVNYLFIGADALQKVVVLVGLFVWIAFSKKSSIDWMISVFSLATMPNTIIVGIPLLKPMYGDYAGDLMVQIVVFQCVLWCILLLVLYEYRSVKLLNNERFKDTATPISSFRVDSAEPLEADAKIGDDGKVPVVITKSISNFSSFHNPDALATATPGASNLDGAEIISVPSFREETVFSTMSCSKAEQNVDKGMPITNKTGRSTSANRRFLPSNQESSSSAASSVSEGNAGLDQIRSLDTSTKFNEDKESFHMEDGIMSKKEKQEEEKEARNTEKHEMPSAMVMARLIVTVVWRKLIRNPNIYATILGLIWSLISFKFNVKLPTFLSGSIKIMSNTGLGMATFSLGLSMGLQPKLVACGKSVAAISMAVRFLGAPITSAATSAAIGLRGDLLRIAIIQAALPQAIVSFVYAKEYDLHSEMFNTMVIFGMIVALPVTILYYVLLGL